MDWDKLRIFHAVAKAESFTGAADILNISQSAISRQIHALEDSLGVKLFHRHARGLVLTEQGEILQETAREMAIRLSRVEERLIDTQEGSAGPLVVTVPDFIGSTWLVPKLKEFREAHPDIRLTILFDDRVLDLSLREADIALRLHTPEQADLVRRHLKSIRFHICASRAYLDAHGYPATAADLKKHTLIAFPENTSPPFSHPNWLLEVAKVDFGREHKLLLLNSMYAIYQAILSDAGIAVLPEYLIHRHEEIEILLPELERPPVEMCFVYASERRNSKKIALFRDFLLETLKRGDF
jgi:DNA-binding transcriptional LysR family regulator